MPLEAAGPSYLLNVYTQGSYQAILFRDPMSLGLNYDSTLVKKQHQTNQKESSV